MPSSSKLKRWRFKNLLASTCGCGCPWLTATDAIEPQTMELESDEKQRRHRCASSTTAVEYLSPANAGMLSPCPKVNDSLAVVKASDDPYRDFRHSMLQMITHKQIYSRTDMQHLLRCFLDLNPPSYHQIIVTAFMDIWNAADHIIA